MAYDDQNIFAKIIAGELPCHKVYEDDHSFAFLDIMPRTAGHTLVLPRTAAENILDIDAESLAHLMATVRKLAPKIVKAMDADGFILQQFNGAAAGQTVFHLHVHILPRKEGGRLKHHGSEDNMADEKDLEAVAARIRAEIDA